MSGAEATTTHPPVAIVTGGAQGIGWATVGLLLNRGWNVAVFDKNVDAAEACAQERGSACVGLGCDVTNADSVKRAVAAVVARWGRLDALVNNAGIGDQSLPTLQQKVEGFDEVLSVHLRGTFLMSQAALAQMATQDRDSKGVRGVITNLGSIAGLGGIPGRNAYSAAKAGVLGMTRAMAMEWAREGVRINAVAPGYVETALVQTLINQGALDAGAIHRRTPMGRMAQPDEVAECIVFLSSPAASYITGAVLSVDGGWSALGAPESALPPLG